MSEPVAEAPLSQRRFLPATIVACAFFMEMLDSTAIITALPAIAHSLDAPLLQLTLGLTIYMVGLVVFTPASGWAAERWGARRVFAFAMGLFVVASALCGLSQDLWQFVGARLLQGVAASMMSPVGRLVVLRTTPKRDLVQAINFMTAPGLIGLVLGPAVGGFIATYADWRWIFLLNLPIGIAGVFLVFRWLPSLPPLHRRAFDWFGFALNGVAMVMLVWGLDLIGGQGDWRIGALTSVGGLAVGAFSVLRALRIEHPLVDLSPFRLATYRVTCLSAGSFFRFALAGPALAIPLLLQVGMGMSAFLAGMLLFVNAGADLLIKSVTTRIVRGIGFRSLLVASSLMYALGLAACLFFTRETSIVVVILALIVMGVARSLQMTGQNSLQFADVPEDRLAAASTLSAISQHVVRAIGLAMAAAAINLAVYMRDGAQGVMAIMDIRWAFGLAIAATLIGATIYTGLDRRTAEHVSGHVPFKA